MTKNLNTSKMLGKYFTLVVIIFLQNNYVVFSLSASSAPSSSSSRNTKCIRKIGVITSGGDCPSLNACIRAILKTATAKNIVVYGLPNGFPGLLQDPPVAFELDYESFSSTSMLNKGGSRLGGFVASDYKPVFDTLTMDEKATQITAGIARLGIDAIIATGGDSSFDRIASLLRYAEDKEGEDNQNKIPFLGIPKTIDNDVPKTIFSLGFQSAVSAAAQAIADVRDTAESHRRVIVVECMGRDAGFLALHAGLAGGADTILLPEFTIDATALLEHVKRVYSENQCAVVAVSESINIPQTGETAMYTTADGRARLGGSAEAVARFIAESLKIDARHLVLGHLQRGGSPNAFDQVLATTLGAHAVNKVCDGVSGAFVTWNGSDIEIVPLEKVRGVNSKCVTTNYPELVAARSMDIYCGEVP